MPVFIPAIKRSLAKTQDIDIAMIGTDIYYTACHLEKIQVFALVVKNILYQAEKKARAKINPKNIVSKEYYNFLNIFSKKKSDTLFSY